MPKSRRSLPPRVPAAFVPYGGITGPNMLPVEVPNLAPVAGLGVFAAHVGARGLTQATWRAAVAAYAARRAAGASGGAVLLQNGDVLSAADAAPRRARHPVYRPSRPKHARSRLSRRDRRRLALLDQVAARSEGDAGEAMRELRDPF